MPTCVVCGTTESPNIICRDCLEKAQRRGNELASAVGKLQDMCDETPVESVTAVAPKDYGTLIDDSDTLAKAQEGQVDSGEMRARSQSGGFALGAFRGQVPDFAPTTHDSVTAVGTPALAERRPVERERQIDVDTAEFQRVQIPAEARREATVEEVKYLKPRYLREAPMEVDIREFLADPPPRRPKETRRVEAKPPQEEPPADYIAETHPPAAEDEQIEEEAPIEAVEAEQEKPRLVDNPSEKPVTTPWLIMGVSGLLSAAAVFVLADAILGGVVIGLLAAGATFAVHRAVVD